MSECKPEFNHKEFSEVLTEFTKGNSECAFSYLLIKCNSTQWCDQALGYIKRHLTNKIDKFTPSLSSFMAYILMSNKDCAKDEMVAFVEQHVRFLASQLEVDEPTDSLYAEKWSRIHYCVAACLDSLGLIGTPNARRFLEEMVRDNSNNEYGFIAAANLARCNKAKA